MQLATNQQQFKFELEGLAPDVFAVVDFASDNYGLNCHYSFTINVTTAAYINPHHLIGAAAKLIILWGRDTKYIHGIVVNVACVSSDLLLTGYYYRVILGSPLTQLAGNINCRVFTAITPRALVEQLLAINTWPKYQYALQISKSYKPRNFVLQFNITAWEFLRQIVAEQGWLLFFDQQPEMAKLIITDNVELLPVFSDAFLEFQTQSGMVPEFESVYNLAQVTELSDGAVTPYLGETDCRGLGLGQRFKVKNHYFSELNEVVYYVVGLQLRANQSASAITYSAKFMVKSCAEKSSHSVTAQLCCPLLPGSVYATATERPNLNSCGDYVVRLALTEQQQLKYLANMLVGNNIHLPWHKASQIILALLDEADKLPVILGFVANTQQPLPVTAANNTANIIRTFGGGAMVAEDRKDQEYLLLTAPQKRSFIKLSAQAKAEELRVECCHGDIDLSVARNIILQTDQQHIIKVADQYQALAAAGYYLLTAADNLVLSAANKLQAEVATNLCLITEDDSIYLKALQIVLQASSDWLLTSQQSIAIDAATVYMQTETEFVASAAIGNICLGDGGIVLTADGDIRLNATAVIFNAAEIELRIMTQVQ